MSKKIESKFSSKKIVKGMFALSLIFAIFGTIFFSIMTVLTVQKLDKVDFSSYLSYTDTLEVNKVYGSATQYKVSHILNIENHTPEKLTIDIIVTYKNSDGSMFVKTKEVVLQAAVTQNVYVYYYHEDSLVTMQTVNFRLDNKVNFTVLYDNATYDRLYQDYNIITFGNVRQNIMLMAICILMLVLITILYVVTMAMFKNNSKKYRNRKFKSKENSNESNRSEQSL
ncbi:MAG: hypothetical protein J6V40_03365 [Clostridia bacterium]|nr:hypothetical protein [Clostridia bacterium]